MMPDEEPGDGGERLDVELNGDESLSDEEQEGYGSMSGDQNRYGSMNGDQDGYGSMNGDQDGYGSLKEERKEDVGLKGEQGGYESLNEERNENESIGEEQSEDESMKEEQSEDVSMKVFGEAGSMRVEERWNEVDEIGGLPLVVATRGGMAENVHRGHVAVVRADGKLVAAAGNADVWTFMRSTAKPIQAIAAILAGAVEKAGLDDAALALMSASHQGEAEHMAVLERMLVQTGVAEEELIFHETLPSGMKGRHEWQQGGGQPRKLYHVCAGKHIGMLALSKQRGWPLDSYWQPDHPLQREVLRIVSIFAGLPPEAIRLAIDGCGLPVFAMPLWRIALAYARLAAQPEAWADTAVRAAAARIAAAMNSHPALVEGSGRLATTMLGDGNVVAKSGAQGIFVFALRQEQLAVAIKMDDGTESAWPQAACAVLEQLRIGGELAERIRSGFPPSIINDAGQTVGRREPCLRLRLL
ncbi:asparaginase [Paenibacillus oenotherae]|uniref:Asparaginase n=1 Tax=Paenibacillus oenotherae TaxID=1435645 RepID=A0ABS7DB78_9BACL|nr:asparaginase [Paenibacillus oenotherae]MBW7476757.1 asparaginase [Paenibacillus oenotherae]